MCVSVSVCMCAFLQGATEGEPLDMEQAKRLLFMLQNTDNLQVCPWLPLGARLTSMLAP